MFLPHSSTVVLAAVMSLLSLPLPRLSPSIPHAAASPASGILLVDAFSLGNGCTRRLALTTMTRAPVLLVATAAPSLALAAADCYQDCFRNCQKIAPKSTDYCQATCVDYCAQDDRTDGLSGSVSAEGGEVGLLGGSFGTGTVVQGQDRPPQVTIPGLDFTSADGRKLIGY